MMLNLQGIQDRFNYPDAIALGLRGEHARLLTQEANHHADRILAFHSNAAQHIDGIQQTSMLHKQECALPSSVDATTDQYAFIFFANLHYAQLRIYKHRL